ncbi:Arp2/3 complex subunit, actin nucleation center [Mucor velutinosus]|uniref:Arp2/3 complex subunit, actin nucleation center n=1 Tax=Mucor velutinosus TaxID=708070 RepID=A0AAN7I0D3_9FUNG|nr:Arp2/3 complex subunit, actin nucleation center [Mucor velutinosus]
MLLYLTSSFRSLPRQTKAVHVLLRPIFRQESSKSGKRGGPASEKLKAIPFAQHIKAAEKTFEDYHGKGFFSARVSKTSPPEQAFLPFWVVSATVHATIEQAQVGRRVMRTRYNPATKRNESMWETDWAWVPEKHSFTRDYVPLAHPGLQIYASHRYRRGLVDHITTGPALENAVPFTPALLDTDDRDVTRKVDPFMIYPSTALRFAKSYIQDTEEALADDFLRKLYGMDETRLLKINIQMENVRVSPVYYPAFIYSVNYLGRRLRTFINGYDLTVGGTKIYNWERVAVVSALGMATAMALTGGVGVGGASGSFWLGIVFPTVATSFLAMYYPILSLYVRDIMRNQEIKAMAQDSDTWDSDWVKGYAAFEDQERRRTWREEKQSSWYNTSSNEQRGGGSDPKGYYKALGVSTSATQSDIQSAFRGLAMKWHPDRFTDAEEKNKAKVKFQAISSAYSVLRDAKKRKHYDQTGRD